MQFSRSVSERLVHAWWFVFFEGAISLAVGIFLLISQLRTLKAVALVIGGYWLITGVISLAQHIFRRTGKSPGFSIISNIVGIAAGIFVLYQPLFNVNVSQKSIVYVIGAAGLVMGVLDLIQGKISKTLGSYLEGVVKILIGLFLLIFPSFSAYILTLVIGAVAVIGGICYIMYALGLRGRKQGTTGQAHAGS